MNDDKPLGADAAAVVGAGSSDTPKLSRADRPVFPYSMGHGIGRKATPTHTPGPWRVVCHNGSPWEIVPASGRTVECNCADCEADAMGGRTYSNIIETDSHVYGPTLQDAHLIAAAPEMKEALIAVRDWLESFSVPPTATIDEKERHYEIVHRAIAKAEGR